MNTRASGPTVKDRWRPLFLLLCVAIGALAVVLRLAGLNKGLWLDEYYSLEACCRTQGIEWLRQVAAQSPAYLIPLSWWARIDTGTVFLRVPSVICGLATLAVTMGWLARRSRGAAVLGGALLACSPLLLRYSQEIRGYALLALLAAAVLALVSRADALERRALRWLLSLLLTLAVTTHPTGVLLVPTVIAYMAVSGRRGTGSVWTWTCILVLPLATSALVMLVTARLQSGALAHWWMPPLSAAVLHGVARVVAGTDRLGWPFVGPISTTVIVAAALTVAALLRMSPSGEQAKEADPPGSAVPPVPAHASGAREGVALLSAAAVHVAGLMALSLVLPVFWPRTALVALVPAVSGLALLCATHRRATIRLVAGVAVVALCSGWAARWLGGEAWRPVEPWQEAATWLRQQWRPGDVLIVYPRYVAGLTLFYAVGIDPSAVVPLGPDEAPDALERKVVAARVSARRADGATFVLVRADLTVRTRNDTYERLLAVLRSPTADTSGVTLAVVTAGDVEVVPALAGTAVQMIERAAAILGPPLQTTRLAPALLAIEFAGDAPAPRPPVGADARRRLAEPVVRRAP